MRSGTTLRFGVAGLVLAAVFSLGGTGGHGQAPTEGLVLQEPSRVRIVPGWFVQGRSPEEIAGDIRHCDAWQSRVDGCRLHPDAEGPLRRVWLDAYWIDRREVSIAEWRECTGAGGCPWTEGLFSGQHGDYPMHSVSREEARRFCQWRGGDLPTEAQWEKAARGPQPRRYPWGEVFRTPLNPGWDPEGVRALVPVSAPSGRSPYGVEHLGGNVLEWVLDGWVEGYPGPSEVHEPLRRGDGDAVVRGGCFDCPNIDWRTSSRHRVMPGVRNLRVGFRCAYRRSDF